MDSSGRSGQNFLSANIAGCIVGDAVRQGLPVRQDLYHKPAPGIYLMHSLEIRPGNAPGK
jgi:hypothetical protein